MYNNLLEHFYSRNSCAFRKRQTKFLLKPFLLSIVFAFLLTKQISAQAPGYSFASAAGSYTAITGGTQHSSGSGMDDATFSVTLPFSFNFNGTSFTQVYLSENGYVSFGATDPGTTTRYAISSANTGFALAAAFSGDLQGDTATSELRSQTTGTAPNRTFIVQWTRMKQYFGSGLKYNFQIQLEEANGVVTSQVIRFVYGQISSTSATNSYQVGLRGLTNASYINRTTNTNWASTTAGATNADACTVSSTVAPASGLTYTWTQVPATYGSSTTTQAVNTPLTPGTTNAQIIGVQVVVTGGNVNPLSMASLSLNTTGTSAVSDITNAKVYYTGTSATFATGTQFGSTVNNPSGSFTVTGTQTLSFGTNYFWVTYDVSAGAAVNNVLDAQCTQITIGSTNYTPTVTNPTGSRTILLPLSGTYTVGTGGNFATLTAAAAMINAAGVSGAVTFNLTDNNYSSNETFPVTFGVIAGASSTNTLTIKPAAGVTPTITGSASALLQFNGTDFVTLNGSNSNTNTVDLTLSNSSTGTSAAIALGSLGTAAGATNFTIRNCMIFGGSSTATGVMGISVAGTTLSTSGTGADNDNVTISNNYINRAYYGIYARGVSTALNDNLVISGNVMGDANPVNTITFGGIDVQNASNPIIQANRISNMSQTAGISTSPYAIGIGGTITAGYVIGNMINGVRNPSSGGWGAYGITVGGTITNLFIINNDISDISTMNYSTSSTTFNAFGIRITTTGAFNIYNNSVNLFGAVPNVGTTPHFSAAIMFISGTTIDLRNNVFVNTQNGLTGAKSYAIYATVANTAFASTTNRNNYFVSGANGVLGYIATADRTTLTDWQTAIASSKDANSISSAPGFNANNNLRPTTGSALLNAGATVAGVTTDLRSVTRNASTPTLGAYELAGEFIAPLLTFTPLGNTISTSNRTTTSFATITDASGVNTTSGTRPRLYFRKSTNANTFAGNTSADNGWKWVEANNTSSPFDFTINYALLTGGAANPGDVIQYFVIAQDIAATPNVTFSAGGSNLMGFNSLPTSVNITAGNFPVWGTYATYTIAQQLTGTYLVGTGQQFTSLTNTGGFFQYVNNNVIAGDVVVLITSNLNETGTVALNQTSEIGGSNFKISIQPSAPSIRTISGNYAGGLIRLNGADRVTFDGRFNNTGTGNYLSIVNSATSGVTAGIQLSSLGNGQGATNNTIRNCTFSLPRTGPTSIAIAVGGTVGNTGSDNDTLTIMNNTIRSGAYGIYVGGNVAPNTTDEVVINNNIIGGDTLATSGALLANITGLTCTNNSISNVISTAPTALTINAVRNASFANNSIWNVQGSAGNPVGLSLVSTDSNIVVNNNMIRNVFYTGTGGYGGKGVDINTTLANSNIVLANNVISNISGDGWTLGTDIIAGIRIVGTSAGISLRHNTVNLSGLISRSGATADVSAALVIASTTVSNIQLLNNIFRNSLFNTAGTQTSYAIYNTGAASIFSSIAYNNFIGIGAQSMLGYQGANIPTLNAWRTAVTADLTSKSRVVNFVDTAASNLRLAGSSNGDFYLRSLNLNNSITNADYDNVTRRPISYMGAFEASTPLTMSVNAGTDTTICSGNSVQVGGSNIVTGGIAPYTYSWSPAADSVSNPTLSPAITTTYIVTATDTFGFSSRDTVVVSVNATPASPASTNPSAICAGNTVVLNATGTGTLTWFKNLSGGTALGTGNSYTTGALTANDSFYVAAVSTAGCASSRTKVNVTVNAIPAAPNVAVQPTICAGSTATIISDVTAGSRKWYTVATGGTSIYTGDTLVTAALTANTNYYVENNVNSCISTTRTLVKVTVNALPTAPVITTPAAICSGNSAMIIANSGAGSRRWYTNATGGSAIYTGDTLTTSTLTANTTYYADNIENGCVSSTRKSVVVTVNAIPSLPSVQDIAVCDGSTGTLTATGFATGDSIMWYDAATNGNMLGSGSAYTTSTLSANATYYAGIKSAAGCINAARTSALVTVNPIPTAPQVTNQTACEGTSAIFDYTNTTGSLKWYDEATGGSVSHTGNVFNTGIVTDNDTFYVSVTELGCESPRTQAAVVVTKLAAVPSASNTKVCEGLAATLTATSGTADIFWYTNLFGGSPIDSGSTISVNGITQTSIYYAEARNGVCATAERKPVVVVFYNKPNGTFTVQSQFMGGITFAPTTANGLAYNWSFGDGNNSTVVNPTHKYTTNGNYNVKLVVVNPTSGCSDSSTQAVSVVSVGFADAKSNSFNAEVYPNPFTGSAQLSYTLPVAETVSIRVVNLLGQEVMQLPAGLKQAGTHQVDFNATNLSSGVYYVRLQVGNTQHTLRVVKAN